MKIFTAGIALALCVGAQAAPWWTPSPVSLALTVGRWISIDREEVFDIRVQAHGTSDSTARDEAFRIAVDRAVGSLMLVNTESQLGDVTRHEVINYAAGYVHDFTLVSREIDGKGVRVVMDVRVKRSTIADRLLAESRGSASISGTGISVRNETMLRELRYGDQVLDAVLRDYPRRAFLIQIQAHRTRLMPDRGVEIEIDARLEFDPRYLRALHETLTRIGGNRADAHQHQVTLDYTEPGSFFRTSTQVGFDDARRIVMFRHYFLDSNPHIRVRVQGQNGTITTQCFSHNELSQTGYQPARRFVHWGENRTTIHGSLVTQPRINISLPPAAVAQLKHLDVEVVSQVQCKSVQRNHIYTTRHGHS